MPASKIKKICVAFAVVGLLLMSSPLAIAVVPSASAQVSFPTIIESGSMVDGATYVIFTDGYNTFAKNGTTGRIDYRSSNASAVFQDVIDRANGAIYVKAGDYLIDSTIWLRSDTTLIGDGANLVSQSDDLTIMSTPINIAGKGTIINAVGSDRSPLTVDVQAGESVITVGSTDFVSIGDWILIASEEKWRDTPDTFDGELLEVVDKTATTITLSSHLVDGYQTAYNATAFSVPMVHNISISGMNFIGKNKLANGFGLRLYQVVEAQVRSCNFLNNGYAHIAVFDGQRVDIDQASFIGTQPVGAGYGVSVAAASKMVTISNSYFGDCKHGFTNGQSLYGIPRHITLTNCIFDRTYDERQHGAGEFITYDRCVFQGTTAVIETPNCLIQNSEFFGRGIFVGRESGYFTNITNLRIVGNYLSTGLNVNPINVFLANGLLIQDNVINLPQYVTGYRAGISLTLPAGFDQDRFTYRDIRIIGNEINSANYGIHLSIDEVPGRKVDNILIADNRITCKTSAINLIGYYNGTTITGNSISGGYIYLEGGVGVRGPSIIGNTIDNNGIGIYLKDSSNVLIERNRLICNTGDGTTAALYIMTTSNGAIDDVMIIENTIINAGNHAVRISNANNVSFDGNELSSASRGIWASYAHDLRFADNIVSAPTEYYILTSARTTYGGIGDNGANDPATAGEWHGYGYDGLRVKWTDGESHYISTYLNGTWLDMVVT